MGGAQRVGDAQLLQQMARLNTGGAVFNVQVPLAGVCHNLSQIVRVGTLQMHGVDLDAIQSQFHSPVHKAEKIHGRVVLGLKDVVLAERQVIAVAEQAQFDVAMHGGCLLRLCWWFQYKPERAVQFLFRNKSKRALWRGMIK